MAKKSEMTEMEARGALREMMGRQWMLNGTVLRLLRGEARDGQVRLVTDKRDIVFPLGQARERLAELLPVLEGGDGDGGEAPALPAAAPAAAMPAGLLISRQGAELAAIVRANIGRIASGDMSREQASAINDQIRSVIDLCRVEAEVFRTMAAVHRGAR